MTGETITGGDLKLSAAELRRAAAEADGRGEAVFAKRLRLAAWGQEFSASALRGELDDIGPEEAAGLAPAR